MFCDPDNAIDSARFIAPRLEAELAFVMRRGLSGPNCSMLDVMRATECVLPAVEILDARIERIDPETGAQRTVLDNISDNAANAALVLGKSPIPKQKLDDLRWIATLCYRNAQIEETGVSAAVLGHPAVAVAWLANKLTSLGTSLAPGDVVLSGSFIRPVEIGRGDVFHVDFGSVGAIACRFK